MPKPIIILDASYLSWLEKIDKSCRGEDFQPPISEERMPFAALQYLMDQGCHIVIPNEVLKETTHDGKKRVGLSCSPEKGKAYLNPRHLESIDARDYPRLHDWLVRLNENRQLHCCNSASAFFEAVHIGLLTDGSLSYRASPCRETASALTRRIKARAPGMTISLRSFMPLTTSIIIRHL
jgi:hypothetical protein